jgi:hypothetical protein
MQRLPLDSSTLASMGYDPEHRVLELEYRKTGDIYQYFDVPPEEYEAFLKAESKGAYLNQEFKLRSYRYVRVATKPKKVS